MNSFKVVKTKEASMDAFDLKNKWMLVTAAKSDGSVNTMTANWGGLGIMWNKEVAYVVIRPQRFTKEFVDEATTFTLTFFAEDYKKKALTYLGKVSGRDEDKIAKAGLTICKDEEGVPYFAEAESVFFSLWWRNLFWIKRSFPNGIRRVISIICTLLRFAK